jgi:hypothetical protein
MSKIIGEKSIIEMADKAAPGSKYTFVNMEAIKELPDVYESVVTGIKIDISKDFSEIVKGKQYMPTTDLSYRIAEACGISGTEFSEYNDIYDEVDVNPMLMKSMFDVPTIKRIKVGVQVSKKSRRMMEDGSYLESGVANHLFNVWDRCCEEWSKEEMYTEGYSKPPKYGSNKYDTTWKRQHHYWDMMKFAGQKAETKAYCKTIRELASLPTAFTPADLKKGVLIFSKIRRSSESLKLENAARLTALSKGLEAPKTDLLFGEEEEPKIIQAEELTEVKVKKPDILEAMKCYKELVDNPLLDTMINWYSSNSEVGKDHPQYIKMAKNIKAIEETLDPGQRIEWE